MQSAAEGGGLRRSCQHAACDAGLTGGPLGVVVESLGRAEVLLLKEHQPPARALATRNDETLAMTTAHAHLELVLLDDSTHRTVDDHDALHKNCKRPSQR